MTKRHLPAGLFIPLYEFGWGIFMLEDNLFVHPKVAHSGDSISQYHRSDR